MTLATDAQLQTAVGNELRLTGGVSGDGDMAVNTHVVTNAGQVNLKDCFCTVKDGELFVRGMHISPYEHGNIFNRDPVRPRRLLMHKKEILKLYGQVKQEGLALIPLSLYFKGSNVKVQLGLCKGKKLYDKRETIARRDAERDAERELKDSYRP